MPVRPSIWGGMMLRPHRVVRRRRTVGGRRRVRRVVGRSLFRTLPYMRPVPTVGMGRRRRPVRRVMGRGFFSNLWSGIKSVAPAVIKSGIVGNLASRISPEAGGVLKSVGLGRRRRRVGGARRRRPVRYGGRRVVRRRRLF